jgi:uncharacterized protein YjaZ
VLPQRLAQTIAHEAHHAYRRWFVLGGQGLPPWTGYTLGFRLVSAYVERNPGQNVTTLVHAPARAFRPAP